MESEEIREYFDLVKKGLLKITEEGQDAAIQALNAAKTRLQAISDSSSQLVDENGSREEISPIQITQQVFTDKLLISKCSSGQVKSVTRDLQDERFHLDEIDLSDETTWTPNSKVLLQINRLEFI